MDPLSMIGLGSGIIGGIAGLFGRSSANKELDRIKKKNMDLADSRLGLAKTLFNARMPGAAAAEQNINSSAAGTISNVEKNSTDSSQALALAGGVQGQTNNAFSQLNQAENQDAQRRYQNLDAANNGMQGALEDSAQIEGAKNANNQNTWGDISRMGFSLADFGMNGGFDKIFGK